MSVIPLVTDGPNRTVVQQKDDFDIEGRSILMIGIDAGQLNDPAVSNASYDLRIGKEYRDYRETDPTDISDNGVLTLYPGAAFIIESAEFVYLPRRLFGIIAPKVSLLQKGLSITFSKVDPGYQGNLLVTLFNLGHTSQTLKANDPFCALTIFDVEEGAKIYQKGPQRLTARPADQPRRTFREWVEAHQATITMWLAAAILFLLFENGCAFIWSQLHG